MRLSVFLPFIVVLYPVICRRQGVKKGGKCETSAKKKIKHFWTRLVVKDKRRRLSDEKLLTMLYVKLKKIQKFPTNANDSNLLFFSLPAASLNETQTT